MEHRTPNGGMQQGYFCGVCGKPTNMYGTGHGHGKCEPNPLYVQKLMELNKEKANE